MQRRRTQRHPFERVATPYQLYAWCAPQIEHTIDAIRAEDSTFRFIQINKTLNSILLTYGYHILLELYFLFCYY